MTYLPLAFVGLCLGLGVLFASIALGLVGGAPAVLGFLAFVCFAAAFCTPNVIQGVEQGDEV